MSNNLAVAVPLDEVSTKQKAKSLPERYFSFLEARAGQDTMAANLLTSTNLKIIKTYVNNVHALPRTLEEVREEADYETLGVEVERVHRLYSALHRHAAEWGKLERQMKELGPEIELFAETMQGRGGALLEYVENSEIYQAILSEQQAHDAAAVTLTDEQRGLLVALIEKDLKELISEIAETSRRISDVDKRAEWFNEEIDLELRPSLRRVLKHIKTKESDVGLLKLEEQRDEMEKTIEALGKEYDANVGYAFTGMWWGPIGLIITGGIYGAEAEKIRARRNEMILQYDELSDRIVSLKPSLASVEKASKCIQNIQTCTRDLKSATQRLSNVWINLNRFAELSVIESKELATSHDLLAFLNDFAEVISPWRKIKGVCAKLSELFDVLLEEYDDVE